MYYNNDSCYIHNEYITYNYNFSISLILEIRTRQEDTCHTCKKEYNVYYTRSILKLIDILSLSLISIRVK